jgi:hypothetical protein
MKKTGLLFFAMSAMLIVFSSCSKDGFEIEGTWNLDKVETYMGGELIETNENEGTITFNSGGTGTATDDGETDEFNWTLIDNTLTIVFDDETTILTLTTKTEDKMVGEFEETWEGITFKVVITMTKL